MHGELQEVRAREASYRAQLARVLEGDPPVLQPNISPHTNPLSLVLAFRVLPDARVKNAELLESQRQASDGSVQALHWRRAIAAKVSDPPVLGGPYIYPY